MRTLAALALLLAPTLASAQACKSVQKTGAPASYWAYYAAKKADANEPAIVFLGDSITQHWQDASVAGDGAGEGAGVWAASFAPLGAWQAGGSGDTTSHMLWRIGDGLLANKGQATWVVILIGTNNLPGATGSDAWWIRHGVLTVMQSVRQRMPGAKQIVVSILPRGCCGTVRGTANGYLAAAVPNEGAIWLDVEQDFAPGGDMDEGLYAGDLIHLSSDGYQVLAGRILAAMGEE